MASSSSAPQIKCEVFLSFRGTDTRNKFTSHLHKALCDKQIDTFIDDQLNRGDEISPSLLRSIAESQISIIIFSKEYASSRWCLEELVKILECRENYEQIVIPVFYGVDPSDVRNQKGSYADAFAKHERFKESSDKVQRWKDALKIAADISGFDSLFKPESVLVNNIVDTVLKKLRNNMLPSYDKDLVGIYSGITIIESWLMRGDVRSVGIWGIGGIGKTTLAQAVFDKLSCQFDGSGFAGSVRETSKQEGLNSLRQGLLSTLLKDEYAYICPSTKKWLGRKKLLIVFDDVTDSDQIVKLIGNPNLLALESRIIVTSRDKQVLKNICREDHIYEVKELCSSNALKLFCRHAFKQNRPNVDYRELSNSVVKKVGGVPLALKVFGSALFDKPKKVWESALEKLENISNEKIHKKLKISYDELDSDEKNIFLDIACFFKWWDFDHVKVIMDACGFFTESGISDLIDKSLITKSGSMLTMHDLLQAMGKEIVRQESINDPGKRTRLWHLNDIYRILTTATGTDKIEGVCLNMSTARDIDLHPLAFVKMPNLRLLQFYTSNYCQDNEKNKVHVSQVLGSVFKELKYLYWYRCPMKALHSNFHLENLVILKMPYSNVEELWSGVQQLDNLKEIDLEGSKQLMRCPDLSGAQNLKSLKLSWCTSLFEIPLSIQHLNKLESLDLFYCKSLTSIPDCSVLKSLKVLRLHFCSKLKRLPKLPNSLETIGFIDCKSLVEIPSSFKYLNKMESLDLFGCESLTNIPDLRGWKYLKELRGRWCRKLKMLPEVPNSIERIDLRDTLIEELHASFEDLDSLKCLFLNGCSMQTLPSSICKCKSLETLCLRNCSKIDKLPDDIGTLESLKHFEAGGTAIREVPPSISCLRGLYYLDFSGSKGEDGVGLLLPPLLGLDNLTYLYLSDCGITELPDSLGSLTSLKTLYLDRNNFESIPGSIINLSKIVVLNIRYCEKLKVLPKLPYLTSINAANCTSLEEFSCHSFPNENFELYSDNERMVANFTNCFKLNRNSLDYFVKDILWALLMKRYYHKVCRAKLPYFSICYPGVDIPEWVDYRSTGSFIYVKLPQKFSYGTLCLALCIVVTIPDPDYQCDHHGNYYSECSNFDFECNFNFGRIKMFREPQDSFFRQPCGPNCIRSNHVILNFNYPFTNGYCHNGVSFQFYAIDKSESKIDHVKVEKCGVHFTTGPYIEKSRENEEEDEPHPKRLKHIE